MYATSVASEKAEVSLPNPKVAMNLIGLIKPELR
jgi:hypothetical protein